MTNKVIVRGQRPTVADLEYKRDAGLMILLMSSFLGFIELYSYFVLL